MADFLRQNVWPPPYGAAGLLGDGRQPFPRFGLLGVGPQNVDGLLGYGLTGGDLSNVIASNGNADGGQKPGWSSGLDSIPNFPQPGADGGKAGDSASTAGTGMSPYQLRPADLEPLKFDPGNRAFALPPDDASGGDTSPVNVAARDSTGLGQGSTANPAEQVTSSANRMTLARAAAFDADPANWEAIGHAARLAGNILDAGMATAALSSLAKANFGSEAYARLLKNKLEALDRGPKILGTRVLGARILGPAMTLAADLAAAKASVDKGANPTQAYAHAGGNTASVVAGSEYGAALGGAIGSIGSPLGTAGGAILGGIAGGNLADVKFSDQAKMALPVLVIPDMIQSMADKIGKTLAKPHK